MSLAAGNDRGSKGQCMALARDAWGRIAGVMNRVEMLCEGCAWMRCKKRGGGIVQLDDAMK